MNATIPDRPSFPVPTSHREDIFESGTYTRDDAEQASVRPADLRRLP